MVCLAPVFLCHLLDEGDGFGRQFGPAAMVTRFEFPEPSETLTMATEKGIGFENEQGFLPILDATGEEDEPEAIRLRTGRLFDLAIKGNKLLVEKSILGDQVRLGASQVGGSATNHRMAGRLSEMQGSMFKEGDEMAEQ
jgi:hypothetical protein